MLDRSSTAASSSRTSFATAHARNTADANTVPVVPAGAAAEKMCTRLAAGGDFDYGCVLGAAIMFYEAQRSGKLPAGNRIPWRGNSGLQDKAPNGASIVGGWYVERRVCS
jgi:hypothetical protein